MAEIKELDNDKYYFSFKPNFGYTTEGAPAGGSEPLGAVSGCVDVDTDQDDILLA